MVWLAVLVLGCSDPGAADKGAGPAAAQLPSYPVHRSAARIEIDGRFDEPAWRDAPRAVLTNSLTGRPLRRPTSARLLWDGKTLYAGFECQDDLPWARPGRKDDDPIYEDEVVELFLDPSGAGRDYAEIEVSPANVRFDAQFASYRSDPARAIRWQSGARTAVSIRRAPGGGFSGWTAELAIPLERVRQELPRPGDRWRFNLYRLEIRNGAGIREGAAFSPPLRGDFHALDRFGWLVFE